MVAAEFVEGAACRSKLFETGETGIKSQHALFVYVRCEGGGINLDPRPCTSLRDEPLKDQRSVCKDADC